MSIDLIPATRIRLKNREFVLLEDVVDRRFPNDEDVVPISFQNKTAIFCCKENLDQIRKKYPSVLVYGIWQLILASRKYWPKALYAVYFDDDRQSGVFLHCKDGMFNSGSIVAGKLLSVTHEDNLQDAEIICLEADDLVFPRDPVMSRNERGIEIKNRYRKVAVVLVSGITVGILSFWGMSEFLQWQQYEHTEKYQLLSNKVSDLLKKRDLLLANHLLVWPNQWQLLKPLVRLEQEQARFTVWGFQPGQVAEIQLLPNSQYDEAKIPVWMKSLPKMKAERQLDGSFKVNWQAQEERR